MVFGPASRDGPKAMTDLRLTSSQTERTGAADPAGHLRDHLGLALEAGGLGAWQWNIATGVVAWDATLEAIYGLPAGGFDGTVDAYRALIHPEDRHGAAEVAAEALHTCTRYEVEHRIVRPDGTVRRTHGWARPLLDDQGEVAAFIGVVADVTARHAEEEQRERIHAAEAAARADADSARREAELAAHQYEAVAATLQRSLLPPVPPEIPGLDVATCYQPALDGLAVGGDFYDLPRIGRNTWALLLGDVCGKGAAAAAVTGLVRYSARAAATQSAGPAAVLRQVNEVLGRDQDGLDDARFATMLFARLRPRVASLDITFALGGHPRPYVIRADRSVELVGQHGTLLGVLAATKFANTKLTLTAGEAFVVVTDGVLEARHPDLGEFADQLPGLLARHSNATAAELAAAIEEAAIDWQDGPPRDDIAIVVLRVP